MMTFIPARHLLCASIAYTASLALTNAAINMVFEETGANETTVTITGSWDSFNGSGQSGNSTVRSFVGQASYASAIAWNNIGFPSASSSQSIAVGVVPTVPWEGNFNSFTISGDVFGFAIGEWMTPGEISTQIYASPGYTAGSSINTTWVFSQSLSSLGFDAAEISSGGSFDAMGNQVSWSVIPEPSSAVLGGIGVLLLLRRRR